MRVGQALGPYRIVAKLGEGGMGEVYDALDPRLNRRVAIKVLPETTSADQERRARFDREARIIATLNHPHICTLYDVGREGSVDFLVMERLEGATLADHLARGSLKLSDTLLYARQIADALDAAHSRGIVHRDLKPSNVMLTASGVKLLDFGIAKLAPDGPVAADGATRSLLTSEGTFVGTLQYMAPEQLQGGAVDARADIFAFGAIVYEMLTGRRAFDGASPASVIAAVLSAEPPALPPSMSMTMPALDRLVGVCLAKEPAGRWSSAHDLALVIGGIAEERRGPAAPTTPERRWRERAAWTAAALAVLAALGAGLFRGAGVGAPAPAVVTVLPPDGAMLAPGEAPQVSPDGRFLVLAAIGASGRTLLYLRRLDGAEATPLAGTEGASLPFWAPDSRRLGFFAGGALKTTSIAGGAPQTLARAETPRGGTWSGDDTIVFVPEPPVPVQRMSAAGGPATPLPIDTYRLRWFPTFLPDGRHYLFLSLSEGRQGVAIRVGSLDRPDSVELVQSQATATYAEPGYLLYRRETSLVAQRFDTSRLAVSGPPASVAENAALNAITYQALFSASGTGVLAYQAITPTAELVWLDREGRRLTAPGAPADYNAICLTPGGDTVVYDLIDPVSGAVDIWRMNVATGTSTRLTFHPSVDFFPVCSPAGDEVVFATLRNGTPDLYRLALSAPGREELLLDVPAPMVPTDWSNDGRAVVYTTLNPATHWDIWMVPVAGGTPRALVASPADERNGTLSPDGRWLAYVSNESGRFEVYVQSLADGGAKWQITRGGGHQPQWRADGRELYYLTPDRQLTVVPVVPAAAGFSTGRPRVVSSVRAISLEPSDQGAQYAVHPDGSRILVSDAVDAVRPVSLLLQWPGLLTRP